MYERENLNTRNSRGTRGSWMDEGQREEGLGPWHGRTWPDRDGERGRRKEAQEEGRRLEAKGAGQEPAERADGAARGESWPPSPAASEGSSRFQGACGRSLLTRARAASTRRSSPSPRPDPPFRPPSRLRQPLVCESWGSQEPLHLTREMPCVLGCASKWEVGEGAAIRPLAGVGWICWSSAGQP